MGWGLQLTFHYARVRGRVMAKKNSAWRSHWLSWERRPAVPLCRIYHRAPGQEAGIGPRDHITNSAIKTQDTESWKYNWKEVIDAPCSTKDFKAELHLNLHSSLLITTYIFLVLRSTHPPVRMAIIKKLQRISKDTEKREP